MREIQFATNRMIERLRVRDLKELRWRTQLLPELSRAVKRLAGFGCRVALNRLQDGAERSTKFELLALMSEIVRQQRQLLQSLLKLRHRFRHCRTRGGPPCGFA